MRWGIGTSRRVVFIVLAVLAVSVAHSDHFINPPETDPTVPPNGWDEPFPYQRNAYLDFATDPNTWAQDANNPNAKEIIPAPNLPTGPSDNCHFEGDLDNALYPSDWFGWEGDLDYVVDFGGRHGLIGVADAASEEMLVLWHLDNRLDPEPVKHMWIEFEWYQEQDPPGNPLSGWNGVIWPEPGSNVTAWEESTEYLGDDWYRTNIWAELIPNPAWEEFELSFWTDDTVAATVLVDYVHIATECGVPEPGTCMLFGLGLAGLVIWHRRRTGL